MARLDDLVQRIEDDNLRREITSAVSEMKRRMRFGLVFEEHIPEETALAGLPVQVDALVQRRKVPADTTLYRVVALSEDGAEATITPPKDGDPVTLPVGDLIVVKRFGEPIYPALTPLGTVRNGSDEKPYHAVINGENFHALQLLLYLYEGQVDCIYIDPPYNTGARDWKYNNRYVDSNDAWRHSKWLSFMEKRLRLAKRLLQPAGVLVVTIDENELNHLGMLLEKWFPDAVRQLVTICINPSGASGEGLSRVEEYACFCFLGNAKPVPVADDMLTEASGKGEQPIAWESLLRRGNAWYRSKRPNLCYPVLVDTDEHRIVGTGKPFDGDDESQRAQSIDGWPLAWPVRKDGRLGIWRVEADTLKSLAAEGYAYLSSRDDERGTWTLKYLMSGTVNAIKKGDVEVTGKGVRGEVLLRQTVRRGTTAKTIWHRGRHTAGGSGGTQLLAALLGERDAFPFPKSVYSVQDALAVAVGNRTDALIVDFFAGSGTTLNATCLLNTEDGGTRRSVLVTNNEVDEETTRRLNKRGLFRGDPEFESHGIFERATKPRCTAAVSGVRPDSKPVEGDYINGRSYAEGFPENVEFFRLDYLDADDVDMGRQFAAILPALWLAAGGRGSRSAPHKCAAFLLPDDAPFAVLFDEARFSAFCEALAQRPDVTHVWLVTDSEEAFAEMRGALSTRLKVGMLYRDYLRNFRINTERSL